MMFHLVLFLLGLAAAAFIAAPLLLRRQEDDVDRQAVNLDLYHQRLTDLNSESEEAEFLELEARRSLLGDVTEEAKSASLESKRSWLILPAVLVPIFAILLYADFGVGRGSITDVRLTEKLQSLDMTDPQSTAVVLDQLAERAAERPEDGELNFYVARSYSSLGRYNAAIAVFQRLLRQYPDDASLHSYYAETLFVADERQMTPRVRSAVDTAIALNPHDITLLEIQGIAAINERRLEDALDWFSQALAAGASGRRGEVIRSAVTALHKQLGTVGVSDDGRSIKIAVSATAEVRLPEESAVFVYARSIDGPPAPLAVQRLTLAELPLMITLDEGMAMIPGMGLGDFDRVMIVARVSQSGDVMPKPGDMEARPVEIDMNQIPELVELVIGYPVD